MPPAGALDAPILGCIALRANVLFRCALSFAIRRATNRNDTSSVLPQALTTSPPHIPKLPLRLAPITKISAVMSTKDQADSVLRVVSNRCRNLRKVIDRARTLELAEKKGQQLNEEQRESVRGMPRKEALLSELQEILKKQTAVLEPPQQETKMSRRAQKAAKAKAREMKESLKAVSEKSSEEGERHEKVPEAVLRASPVVSENVQVNGNEDAVAKKEASDDSREKERQAAQAQLAEVEKLKKNLAELSMEKDTLQREMADLKINHEHQLVQEKNESVRSTLNLLHVADFLRQTGSREALHSYYETPEGKMSPLVLTPLHLDLVCYFNLMLTSPNGNVPHPEAVDVSTAHCVEYLKGATSEPFTGTSYATLVEIVHAIASCPILTDRGVPPEEIKQRNRSGHEKNIAQTRPRSFPENGDTEPSPIVNNPVANRDAP